MYFWIKLYYYYKAVIKYWCSYMHTKFSRHITYTTHTHFNYTIRNTMPIMKMDVDEPTENNENHYIRFHSAKMRDYYNMEAPSMHNCKSLSIPKVWWRNKCEVNEKCKYEWIEIKKQTNERTDVLYLLACVRAYLFRVISSDLIVEIAHIHGRHTSTHK